jgi:transcriptional regulator with XRE-family HTH domain
VKILNKHYNVILRELREDHDLKQSDVAKIINCATYTYQRYEYGVLLIPIDKLIVLADFYDVSTDYMLGRTNNPKMMK